MTLYFGPKLKYASSLGPLDRETSTKSGVYVKMDKDSFTDVGVKSVAKSTTKIGALGAEFTSSKEIGRIETSFLPGPSLR